MDLSELEKIIGHTFKNRELLEEALTHPSYDNQLGPSISYNRLEFLGDAVIGLAISNYFFETYPYLKEGNLTDLRAANVSTEKFARVSVRHRFFDFLRHKLPDLDQRVKEFEVSVIKEQDLDDLVVHGGLVQAEDVLADIVESVAAAIFIDIDSDLDGLWKVIKKLLEPIFMPEDLERNPHPVKRLYEICDRNGKKLEFRNERKDPESCFSVYVDGDFIASASANKQDAAKLNAARLALENLPEDMNTTIDPLDSISNSLGTEDAKQKLQEICDKKRWSRPTYSSIDKERGPDHDKRFICKVKIENVDGEIVGEERRTKVESEKFAALNMINFLKDRRKN